jgi:L-lactate dehydrogenase complex protein LldG
VSDARSAILAQVRLALSAGRDDATASAAVEAWTTRPPRHTRPALREAPADGFAARFRAHGGAVASLERLEDLPAAAAAYLQANALPPRFLVGEGLASLPWPAGLELCTGAARREDLTAVSEAWLGIAETGAVVFGSGPRSPTTHNFVPAHQLVLLRRAAIVSHLEDAWAELRRLPGGLPRAVNLVTGPSRTGDIEQTVQLGAHGPGRILVFLL